MSDLVTPGEVDAEIDSTSTSHAIGKAGTGAWIVDGADISGAYSSLDETVLNAFAYNSSASSGLDAVIDPGEAYVSGWLCRDTQTTVTLPASATTTVYVGYDASAVLSSGTAPADNANIIVGLAGDFAAEDPRTAIWEFTTDSSTITGDTSLRQLQKPIEFDPTAGVTINPDFSGTNTRYESGGSGAAVDNATDASQLGGVGPSNYARTDIDESFQSIDVDGGTTTDQLVVVNDDNTGWRIGTSSATSSTPFIAPRIAGDTLFGANLEHNGSKWEFGDEVLIGGDDAVTSSSGNYDIQKNGTDGIGVINFKT